MKLQNLWRYFNPPKCGCQESILPCRLLVWYVSICSVLVQEEALTAVELSIRKICTVCNVKITISTIGWTDSLSVMKHQRSEPRHTAGQDDGWTQCLLQLQLQLCCLNGIPYYRQKCVLLSLCCVEANERSAVAGWYLCLHTMAGLGWCWSCVCPSFEYSARHQHHLQTI